MQSEIDTLRADFERFRADTTVDAADLEVGTEDLRQRVQLLERRHKNALGQEFQLSEGHRLKLSHGLQTMRKISSWLELDQEQKVTSAKQAQRQAKSKTERPEKKLNTLLRDGEKGQAQGRLERQKAGNLSPAEKRHFEEHGFDILATPRPLIKRIQDVVSLMVRHHEVGDRLCTNNKAQAIRDIRIRVAGHFTDKETINGVTAMVVDAFEKLEPAKKQNVPPPVTSHMLRDSSQNMMVAAGNVPRKVVQSAPKSVEKPSPVAGARVGHRTIKEALLDIPEAGFTRRLRGSDTELQPINVAQPPVKGLSYGLDRVLFNPGVYRVQDDRSGVYNFDPYLQQLIPVQDFNFDLLPGFKTPSKDSTLLKIAQEHGKKYTGSSSSMTGMLSHFHFLLSRFRPLNNQTISRSLLFKDFHQEFTPVAKVPASIFLRWKPEDGVYAIDADREHDSNNVLSLLGNSLEKLLTLDKADYLKYRRDSTETIPDEKLNSPETYNYTGSGDILMRSQLDAHDSRLPGTGMFDLKTRAIWPIRMDVQNYQDHKDYEIKTQFGKFESYEREYLDMIRATTIKYMLQVRIGRMDGIFVAYHNTQRIFGFQYIPLEELDLSIHGQADRSLGDQEFALSVSMLNDVLNRATERFPNTTLRLLFRTVGNRTRTRMLVFAEPVTEERADKIQSANERAIAAVTAEIKSGKSPTYDERGKRVLDYTVLDSEGGDGTVESSVAEPEELEEVAKETLDTTSNGDVESDTEQQTSAEDVSDPADETEDAAAANEDLLVPDEEHELAEDENEAASDTNWADADLDGTFTDRETASALAASGAQLFAVEIKAQNIVNGAKVDIPGFKQTDEEAYVERQADRSRTFSAAKGDRWDINYSIEEMEPEQAWQHYLVTRKARDMLLDEDLKATDSGMDTIRKLGKEWSRKGKAWREARDKETKGKRKVVLGEEKPLYFRRWSPGMKSTLAP